MLTSNSLASLRTQTKVSVLLSTYNHEKWIAQAIDGILAQRVSFSYEILIIEDCSTDNTRSIVIDFQKRYPDRIKLILSEKNRNDNTNFATAFLASSSQYIARLDGDDHWTSPHKLQRQVDFLDSHPECAMCFHNVTILYEDGSHEPWDRAHGEPKRLSTLEDLLPKNFIPGPSPMLRRDPFADLPDWFYSDKWIDWPLYILSAQHGRVGYINEIMGVYRVHSGGMWSKLSVTQRFEQLMKFYSAINANLDSRYDETIRTVVSQARISSAVSVVDEIRAQIKEREWKRAVQGVLVLLHYYPRGLLALMSERHTLDLRLRASQQRLQAREQQLWLHKQQLLALDEQSGNREEWQVHELEDALAKERQKVRRLRRRSQRLALRIQKLDHQRARSGRVAGTRKLLERLEGLRAKVPWK